MTPLRTIPLPADVSDGAPVELLAVTPLRQRRGNLAAVPAANDETLVRDAIAARLAANPGRCPCGACVLGDSPCAECGATPRSPRPCPCCLGAGTCVLCDDDGMVWS